MNTKLEAENLIQDEIYIEAENRIEESTREVNNAMKILRNNKASRKDNLTAELFKYGGEVLVKKTMEFIHKTGDQIECTNYREVTLP